MTGQILVVDDEPAICSLLKEILEDEGFRVDTAASASDAHSVIDSRTPNLILLDIWMPNTDGIHSAAGSYPADCSRSAPS